MEDAFGAAQDIPRRLDKELRGQLPGLAQGRELLEPLQEHREVPGVCPQPPDEEGTERLGPSEGAQFLLDPGRRVPRIRGIESDELKLTEQELEAFPEDGARAIRRGACEHEERPGPRHHTLAQLVERVPQPQLLEEEKLIQDEDAGGPSLLDQQRNGIQRAIERLPVEPSGQ
jgi:hypothetical protein